MFWSLCGDPWRRDPEIFAPAAAEAAVATRAVVQAVVAAAAADSNSNQQKVECAVAVVVAVDGVVVALQVFVKERIRRNFFYSCTNFL